MWPAPAATTRSFTIVAHAGSKASQFGFDITPSPFVANEGDTVTLNISSNDVVHGFQLGDFGVNVDLIPGKPVTKTFVANSAGSFTYFCTQPSCGTGHTNMVGTFIVNAAPPAPAVTSLSPAAGPVTGGTVVTITGTNFQNGATVTFGDAAAASVTVTSATRITAIAPRRVTDDGQPSTLRRPNQEVASATRV